MPVIGAEKTHRRQGRGTVAFALEGTYSSTSEGADEDPVTGIEQSLGDGSGTPPDSNDATPAVIFLGRPIALTIFRV